MVRSPSGPTSDSEAGDRDEPSWSRAEKTTLLGSTFSRISEMGVAQRRWLRFAARVTGIVHWV